MTDSTFVRARSAEQRHARRTAILSAAAEMLDRHGRVADLSLNELARHVGLAKSNVLRYFETREAVLLALLDSQYTDWLEEVERQLGQVVPARRSRQRGVGIRRVADAIAGTAAGRPVLAELLANAATVLEHNVSGQVAADYKRGAVVQAARLVDLIEQQVGPLPEASRIAAAGGVNLIVGGAWGMCRPSPGMLTAYADHPELAAMRLDYRVAVRELVATLLTGLLARPVSLEDHLAES